MTQKEAYIEGFCKAAEAHGVDPEQLMKVAKRLGGPDPAPGMLGASRHAPKKPGILDAIVNSVPRGVKMTPLGPRLLTAGDMEKMTKGMSPLHKALVQFNPMLLNFRKAAEARGADTQKLTKVARKNDTKKNVAIGAGTGLAAGSAYPMARIPFDLHTANRLADKTLASLSPFERKVLGPGGLDATVSSVKKMIIKGRIRQALTLGIPLSAVGGIAGYLKSKMN